MRLQNITRNVMAVLTVFFTLLWFDSTSLVAAPAAEKLTIAEASQPAFVLLYIAEAKGYLMDEGLDVTFKSFTSGRDALASVIDGEADLATVFETPVVLRTLGGEKLSVISELHNSTRNTALVARSDKKISVPSDLKGKRIAVSKKTNGEFFLYLFLTRYGMSPEDVTVVDIKPPDMVMALKKGSVDAIVTWNPHVFNAEQEFSENETKTFYSDEYTECSVLAGSYALVESRPEAMKRLLRALIRAEIFLSENQQEAIEIVINRLLEVPRNTVLGVWDNFNAELRLSNILLTGLTQQAEWFLDYESEGGAASDFRAVLFEDYLMEVKRESVTVY